MTANVIQSAKMAITMPCYMGKSPEEIQTLAEEKFEPIVKFMGDKKFLVGDHHTWLDFYWFETVELVDFVTEGKIYDKFPTLKTYQDSVRDIPSVKAYRSSDRWLNLQFNNKHAKVNGAKNE